MATAIIFGGRRVNVPGSYSVIDASELAGVSPSAIGVVALVGTAEGGKPLTVESDFSDFTRPEKVLRTYRSGDLRIAGQFAFAPSLDDAVPGGASRLVCVKVNPATQSSLTLPDALAADVVELTSRDWGLFTNQINVEIDAGTTQGRRVTIGFEDVEEVFDNIGGDPVFDLTYVNTQLTAGFDTAAASLTASEFRVEATIGATGLVAQRTADIAAAGVVRVVSDSAADASDVTIYGSLAGVAVRETLTLDGTTPVVGAATFDTILGMVKGVTQGTITLSDDVIPTTIMTAADVVQSRGVVLVGDAPSAGVLDILIDVSAPGVLAGVWGRNAAGAVVGQVFDMTALSQTSTTAFAHVDVIALGDVAGARTVTLDVNAMVAPLSLYSTVRRLTDYINSRDGFTATSYISDATTFASAQLDYASGVDVDGVDGEFTRDLQSIITVINRNSTLVTAERVAGADAPPAFTGGPLYLTGGSEGATTATEWAQALALLRMRRVNTIVVLSDDPGVHSLLATLLVEKAGRLRSEANGIIGVGDSGSLATKASIRAQIQALSTRHLSAVAQEVRRSNPDTLEAEWFPPSVLAAIMAGMQAGSPIGEPLTHKRPFVVDVRQQSSWTPEDDREELIDSGLMMLEKVEGVGIRCIRSITTHLADDNPVFCELSANEAANYAVYELRRALELRIGKRGLAGSAASIKALAAAKLNDLVRDEIIVAWRSLAVEQLNDVFPVSVEISPVLPINFIPITIHLVAVREAA